MTDVKEFYAKDRATWRIWLAENHDKEQAVWLIFDKGPNRKLKWPDIVQEALCFGWIDSKAGTVSDTQSKIYVSRRKPTSGWSRLNKVHVEELIANGQMQPAGFKAIETAKQNGAWDFLNKVDDMVMPKELTDQLAKNPTAKAYFDNFPDGAKKIILFWIYSAKRDETRISRIAKTVELAEQNIRANQ